MMSEAVTEAKSRPWIERLWLLFRSGLVGIIATASDLSSPWC